ncbi:hypothetical protein PGTUg99_022994 [Puccinia graminis f. sp. tritici]|uniref:Uncharacterized protein n=1 Tax=Puccinia graminis f. sp. tritici TaxID=56615 RepID=A0A5B0QKP6_PUCGR|nr:hypothetical protein PGTUg99_022994 [Puccinia graminis f. sp. tritici]
MARGRMKPPPTHSKKQSMILLSSDEENNPPDDQMRPSSGSEPDDSQDDSSQPLCKKDLRASPARAVNCGCNSTLQSRAQNSTPIGGGVWGASHLGEVEIHPKTVDVATL